MQKYSPPGSSSCSIGNFDCQLSLKKNTMFIQLSSQLDGKVFETQIMNENVPETLRGICPDIELLYEYFLENNQDASKIAIDDAGNIEVNFIIPYKTREVKKSATISTKPVQLSEMDVLRNLVRKMNLQIRELKSQQSGQGDHFNLELDATLPFANCYTFSENTVTRNNNSTNNYYGLIPKQPLPEKGKCYFKIQILNSTNRTMAIGIVNQLRVGTQQSVNSKDSIYYLANGSIWDDCQATTRGPLLCNGAVLTVSVDFEQEAIRWFVNGIFTTISVLPKAWLNMKLYPMLAMHSLNDKIAILK